MSKRTATVTVRLDPDDVALLTEIRDRLDPAKMAEAFVEQRFPGRDVTSEPHVGAQLTDKDGDIWERFERGWRLITYKERPTDGTSETYVMWREVRNYAPLRFTTDADLPNQTEQLAERERLAERVLDLEDELRDEVTAHGTTRAALLHVTRKREAAVKQADQSYAELEAMWDRYRIAAGQRDEAVRRAERAEDERDAYQARITELETSLANREDIIKVRTRERDEALAWGPSVADNWRRRYKALRADVETKFAVPSNPYNGLRWSREDILARDDERMQTDA